MKLFNIDEEPVHDLEYVKELEPLVRRSITKLHDKLEKLDKTSSPFDDSDKYYEEFNNNVQRWTDSMKRLGAIPLSTIRVKFNLTNGGSYVINKRREGDLYD